MKDRSLNKKVCVDPGSALDSSSVTEKKIWRKPQLTELDYSETNEGLGVGVDLGGRELS